MAGIMKGENRYVLGQAESEEWHIFPATSTNPGCDFLTRRSICLDMGWEEAIDKKLACLNENEARMICAEMGRQICGVCISHLYSTVTQEEQEILDS